MGSIHAVFLVGSLNVVHNGRFNLAVVEDLQAVGVEVVEEGAAFGHFVGSFGSKETVEHSHLGIDGVTGTDPVDGAFHLASVGGVAATGGGVVGAVDAGNVALGVLLNACAGYEVGIAQTHLGARREAEILLGRILHKVVTLYVEFAAEGHLTLAVGLVLGVVDGGEQLFLAGGIVVDDQLDGIQHSHTALSHLVKVLAE